MDSLVKNAADEEQVRNAGNRIANGRERDLEDIRYIVSLPEGRRFLLRLLDKCGVYENEFMACPRTEAFYLGQTNIGQFVLGEVLQADVEGYLTIERERVTNGGRSKERKRRGSGGDTEGDERSA